MKKQSILLLMSTLFFSTLLITCKKEQDPNLSKKEYQFSFGISNLTKTSGLKSISVLNNVVKVILTIQNDDGSATKYTSSVIQILKMNGNYFTQSLMLKTGTYKLTQFVLTDSSNNIIFAAPFAGSQQAQNVQNPLPLSFSVLKNSSVPVSVEVLSTASHTPADFGLTSFSFFEVKTFSFLIGAIDEESGKFLQAKLTVSNGTYSYIQNLDSISNNVATIKDGLNNYTLKLEESGYDTYVHTFSFDSLKLFTDSVGNLPLIIKLQKITEYIVNGGFETGDFSNWQLEGPGLDELSINQLDKRTGKCSAMIQGNGGWVELSRQVTIPKNGILSMSFKLESGGSLLATIGDQILYTSDQPTNGWIDRKWNVSFWEGQTVELVLSVTSKALLDDISLTSSGNGPEVLYNSGFEEGNFNYWNIQKNDAKANITSTEKHSGNYSCELTGHVVVSQYLIVPENKTWHMFVKTPFVYPSHLSLMVWDITTGDQIGISDIYASYSDWTELSFSLKEFSGHLVMLRIFGIIGDSPDEKAFIDDVSIE